MSDPADQLRQLLLDLARSLTWQQELGALGVRRRTTRGPAPPGSVSARRSLSGVRAAGPSPRGPAPQAAPPGSRPDPTSAPPTEAAVVMPRAAESERPSLEEVRAELGDCRRCKLCENRRHIVFGVGNPDADLMFIGEAPGASEDRQGIPFVGRAGQLLTRMIAAMGRSREDVYIANIIKCRPPQNRDPEPDEVVSCEPFLIKQIEAIQPKVIVSLGRVSAQTLLRVRTPISRLRGRWRDYHGVKLMPTFHPAYLLRNPASKRDAWEDLQKVMAELGPTGSEGSR